MNLTFDNDQVGSAEDRSIDVARFGRVLSTIFTFHLHKLKSAHVALDNGFVVFRVCDWLVVSQPDNGRKRDTSNNTVELSGGPFCKKQRRRNVLFNDALNTFYLRLYGVRFTRAHFRSVDDDHARRQKQRRRNE